MIEIYLNDLLLGISYALDYVEREIAGVTDFHSKRVAIIAAEIGREMGYDNDVLMNLVVAAALHDNALSEFQQKETELTGGLLGEHCRLGEENILKMPFYKDVEKAIMYHHENANGTGPFNKKSEEIPVFAKLIHIADIVDVNFNLSFVSRKKYDNVCKFLNENIDVLFDKEIVDAFLKTLPDPVTMQLDIVNLNKCLVKLLLDIPVKYSSEELIGIASIFSKIIDYKSSFTRHHSAGIANKARIMGKYYGWDEDTQAKLYLAGALHDIGKLMVKTDVLEKPGKLSDNEYRHIQNHAYGTYMVLKPIRGMEEISSWAYLHHEKLDGSGYPFGKKADELNDKERLLACLDIYQALREDRPYKEGLEHKTSIEILKTMGVRGLLDMNIIDDIDRCFNNMDLCE